MNAERRREIVPPGCLRACGVCKGRGAPAYPHGVTRTYTIYIYDWEAHNNGCVDLPLYRPEVVYMRSLVCWACKGSGTNATPARTRELEIVAAGVSNA